MGKKGKRVFAGALVAAALVPASAARAGQPRVISGAGRTANDWQLGFTAQLGGSLRGEVTAVGPSGDRYHGVVTCFQIVGDLVVLGGPLESGFTYTLQAVDGGPAAGDLVLFSVGRACDLS